MTVDQSIKWLCEQRVGGRIVARIGRRGSTLVAELGERGTLLADEEGGDVRFHSALGGDTVEAQVTNKIDALSRHLRGGITLHGAAVSSRNAAIAVIGPSGAGKSTLAATLCLGSTIRLVADDTVWVETADELGGQAQVLASQDMVWLMRSSRAALGLNVETLLPKSPLPLPSTSGKRFVLSGVVDLAFDEHVETPLLQRLRGQLALAALSRSAIRFIVDRPEVQSREFLQFQRLIDSCPVYRLTRKHELSQLRETGRLLANLFPSEGGCE